MASEKKKSRSRSQSKLVHSNRRPAPGNGAAPNTKAGSSRPSRRLTFAVCVSNKDYPASLELRKLYRVIADSFASQHGLIRVVDESGEDYLYPSSYFVSVELPKTVIQTLQRIA